MIAELLRAVTAAAIVGCAALFLTRDGPIREILRIAAGILVLAAAAQPFLRGVPVRAWLELPDFADSAALQAEQERVYEDGLRAEAERTIEDYFAARGMTAEASVELADGVVGHVILCMADAYDWTQEDADDFTAWSGVAPEKQEWIWRS